MKWKMSAKRPLLSGLLNERGQFYFLRRGTQQMKRQKSAMFQIGHSADGRRTLNLQPSLTVFRSWLTFPVALIVCVLLCVLFANSASAQTKTYLTGLNMPNLRPMESNLTLPPSLKMPWLWPVADLQEMKRKKEQNSYLYRPRGSAKTMMAFTGKEALLSGPAGTGKSRACLEKMHKAALKYPGARFLIVRKTKESLTESALFTYERYVLGEDNPICSNMQRRSRQAYRYPNGAVIVVGGMDKASKIMSTEYDMIYVQEAIELTEDDWESLTTRLRNGKLPYQSIIADTNPDRPTHWLKQRCDLGKCLFLDSRHEDNPILWDGEKWTERGAAYISVLDALSGARKSRLRFGKWVQAEGAVYDTWDRNTHLIDRFEIPSDWKRYRSIDFGFNNPFTCQWWAEDDDGRLYLYREMYMTQRTVRTHAEKINSLSGEERFSATVCDHDAEDRATLLENGIDSVPAKKEVSVGIDKVKERLVIQKDGKPRLFILRDSLVEVDQALVEAKKPFCTEQEIDGYIWDRPKDGKENKDRPVKLDDHGVDAMRYVVMHVDSPKAKLSQSANPFYS